MDILAKKLIKDLDCEIEPDKKKLKFAAIFPNIIKEEILNQVGEENAKEIESIENYEFEDCVIKVKLFKFINGGYEVHFIKEKGYLTDYYAHFQDIKKIIKEILNYKKDN